MPLQMLRWREGLSCGKTLRWSIRKCLPCAAMLRRKTFRESVLQKAAYWASDDNFCDDNCDDEDDKNWSNDLYESRDFYDNPCANHRQNMSLSMLRVERCVTCCWTVQETSRFLRNVQLPYASEWAQVGIVVLLLHFVRMTFHPSSVFLASPPKLHYFQLKTNA